MKPPSPVRSLAAQIAALPQLTMKDLWALWDKHFPRRPPHNNRAYVEARLAYRIQELALGAELSARAQLERIGEAQSKIKSQRRRELIVTPGTTLVREFNDREHHVTARADGTFDYAGSRFKSLSAVARHITGTQWSGPNFFGLYKAISTRSPK